MPIDDEQRPPKLDQILEGVGCGQKVVGLSGIWWVGGRGGSQREGLNGLMRNSSGGFSLTRDTFRYP